MRFSRCIADAVLLSTAIAGSLDSLAQAPTANRPQRRYMRPSWTTMVAEESGERERKVLEPFKTLGLTSKFNDHGIGVPAVNASGGDNIARDASLQRSISAHGPAIVGKWFDRAVDGTMSANIVMERGRYSQDDMDRMIQLHSTVDRSGAQGWQLLDLTYVVVYDVTKVEYRRDAVKTADKKSGSSNSGGGILDALNKAATGNAPSTPSSSGSTKYVDIYRIEYTADLYKLQWNDSVDALATRLQSTETEELHLQMITNRGVKVWPEGFPETFLTDHWRCRFITENHREIQKSEIQKLISNVLNVDLDFIKAETLCLFDGNPGFSLGQGQ